MIIAKSKALSALMIRAGFTGAELARTAGITQGYANQIINGKRTTRPPTAKKICDALGCRFDDVFLIKGEAADGGADGNHP